jgi:hypothetical protein
VITSQQQDQERERVMNRIPARGRLAVFVWLLFVSVSGVAAQDRFATSSRGGDQTFIVVSVTDLGGGAEDVKLRNPRTGYIHSVTIYIDVTININVNINVGDRVREERDNGRVILIADKGSGGTGGQGGPPPPAPSNPPDRRNPPRPQNPREQTPSLDGYKLYPIGVLQIVNANTPPRDKPLGKSYLDAGTCDVIASGSFTSGGQTPQVPVMRNGKLDSTGVGKSLTKQDVDYYGGQITTDGRGGIAVRKDGSVAIGRQQGRTAADIQRAFGPDVTDFMGGGAVLIEHGQKVSSDDLFKNQAFVNIDPATRRAVPSGRGLDAEQFRSGANHTLVGMKNGQATLIISPPRNGRQLQNDLFAAGFSDVVMFDGGNGFFFTDGKTTLGRSTNNSLGLCVQTRR